MQYKLLHGTDNRWLHLRLEIPSRPSQHQQQQQALRRLRIFFRAKQSHNVSEPSIVCRDTKRGRIRQCLAHRQRRAGHLHVKESVVLLLYANSMLASGARVRDHDRRGLASTVQYKQFVCWSRQVAEQSERRNQQGTGPVEHNPA